MVYPKETMSTPMKSSLQGTPLQVRDKISGVIEGAPHTGFESFREINADEIKRSTSVINPQMKQSIPMPEEPLPNGNSIVGHKLAYRESEEYYYTMFEDEQQKEAKKAELASKLEAGQIELTHSIFGTDQEKTVSMSIHPVESEKHQNLRNMSYTMREA